MDRINSYKVFHQGKWHVVSVGADGGLFKIFIDGLPKNSPCFSTEEEAQRFLQGCADYADEVNSKGAYIHHVPGFRSWNEK